MQFTPPPLAVSECDTIVVITNPKSVTTSQMLTTNKSHYIITVLFVENLLHSAETCDAGQTPFSLLQHTVPSTGFLTCYFEVKSYIMLPYIYLIMETGTSVAGCAASTRTLHHRAATSDLSSHCGDLWPPLYKVASTLEPFVVCWHDITQSHTVRDKQDRDLGLQRS